MLSTSFGRNSLLHTAAFPRLMQKRVSSRDLSGEALETRDYLRCCPREGQLLFARASRGSPPQVPNGVGLIMRNISQAS